MPANRLDGSLDESRRNAALGWTAVTVLCVLAAVHGLEASYRWFVFTGFAVAIVLLPAASARDPFVMPPWELVVLVALPVVDTTVLGETFLTTIATYVAVAAVSLVAVVEIHRFTAVRMTGSFAVALVVITTLAIAATWNVAQWLADVALGTSYIATDRSGDAANHAMMMDFVYAAVAGLLAGVFFDRYVMERSSPSDSLVSPDPSDPANDDPPDEPTPDVATDSVHSLTRGRLEISERTVRRSSRALQFALLALFLYGLAVRDVTTIANAGIALAVTLAPALLARNPRLSLEPELVLWIAGAAFLHAIGSAWLYDLLGPWDNLTHAVSASLVAGAGYAVVRAIDLHTEEIYLPPKTTFVFILLFVLAFGVVWELIEFALGLLGQFFGYEVVLAQHGISDTIGDLFYDLVGAVVVAIWGSVYLTDVSQQIAATLEG